MRLSLCCWQKYLDWCIAFDHHYSYTIAITAELTYQCASQPFKWTNKSFHLPNQKLYHLNTRRTSEKCLRGHHHFHPTSLERIDDNRNMPLLDLQKANHNVMNNQKKIFSPTNQVPEISNRNFHFQCACLYNIGWCCQFLPWKFQLQCLVVKGLVSKKQSW